MKKQNVVFKLAVGLGIGIGALIYTPTAAHASSPCGPVQGATCIAPPNTFHTDMFETFDSVCYDTDCNGHGDTKYKVTYDQFVYYYHINGGVGSTTCDTFSYAADGSCYF
jgi:hypothetical protein